MGNLIDDVRANPDDVHLRGVLADYVEEIYINSPTTKYEEEYNFKILARALREKYATILKDNTNALKGIYCNLDDNTLFDKESGEFNTVKNYVASIIAYPHKFLFKSLKEITSSLVNAFQDTITMYNPHNLDHPIARISFPNPLYDGTNERPTLNVDCCVTKFNEKDEFYAYNPASRYYDVPNYGRIRIIYFHA